MFVNIWYNNSTKMLLFAEAGIVGLMLGVLLMVIYAIIPIVFTSGVIVAGVAGFVVGCCAHLIFEYTGANRWYCDNGNACKV